MFVYVCVYETGKNTRIFRIPFGNVKLETISGNIFENGRHRVTSENLLRPTSVDLKSEIR